MFNHVAPKTTHQLQCSTAEERFGASYWQGCSPLIARGALLTAGQMLGALAWPWKGPLGESVCEHLL